MEQRLLSRISTVLGPCNCSTGGRCARGWHTFARSSARGARAFLGRDSWDPGHVMLNIPNSRTAAFEAQAGRRGGLRWKLNDGRNTHFLRYDVWVQRDADLDFVLEWLPRTLD